MNNLLCVTANITLAENNENDIDLFHRHAVYHLSFLSIHGRPSENRFPMIIFGFHVIKPGKNSQDLISLSKPFIYQLMHNTGALKAL
jgi:hypothetical protein